MLVMYGLCSGRPCLRKTCLCQRAFAIHITRQCQGEGHPGLPSCSLHGIHATEHDPGNDVRLPYANENHLLGATGRRTFDADAVTLGLQATFDAT